MFCLFLSICKWCRLEKILKLIMFCLVRLLRNTRKEICEQNLSREHISRSLAAKHETHKQSGCFKLSAKKAPVKNYIPKIGFLNKVSLGCSAFLVWFLTSPQDNQLFVSV